MAGGDFVAGEFGNGLIKSAEVDATSLRSLGLGEAVAFTSVGDGAAALSFCAFGCDAPAFTKFGGGRPTISGGFGERVGTALTSFGAGEAAALTGLGEDCVFTTAVEDEGDAVPGDAFGWTTLVGLGVPTGAFRPLPGPEPV